MSREFFVTNTLQEAKAELDKNYRMQLPEAETSTILEALDRVVAEDVVSPIDLPTFTRSTMDGYAVRSGDTHGASDQSPIYLNLVGEIGMGEEPKIGLKVTEAVKISTGGMLPKESDAVVMVEYTEKVGDQVEIVKAVAPGENTMQKGEDVQKGSIVLGQGQVIQTQDIGILAGIGLTGLKVFRRPKVAIISTGDEIVNADEDVPPGKIRDINSLSLAASVSKDGAIPILKGIVKDDFKALKARLDEALKEADLVLVSGGSSVGTRDVTLDVIDATGKPGVLVHGISMKPGKPTIIAVCQNKPVFGLSGHPGAALVVYRFLVSPFLRRLRGEMLNRNLDMPRTLKAKLDVNIVSTNGRADFVRVELLEKDGQTWAKPLYGSSGLLKTLLKADGIVYVPLEKSGLKKGQEVLVELL